MNKKTIGHIVFSILIAAASIFAGAWLYANTEIPPKKSNEVFSNFFEEAVLPSEGVTLPVQWGNLGQELTQAGVIDQEKFESLYVARGGLSEEERQWLFGEGNGNIKITQENAGVLLNLLWALGLANKNEILEEGEMNDPSYGGAGGFASTGGWTLAHGDAMEHYSRHTFIALTEEQQALVERVSKNIYRPCCGNSTHFPDCNHGMAMLGLLELVASQGISEEEMYRAALAVNAYWFPDTYIAIAEYLAQEGRRWEEVPAQEILSAQYSSASGYQNVLSKLPSRGRIGGGSCSA